MIADDEIRSIGSLLKPHGVKGEIVAGLDCDVQLEDLRCIVLKIDGINVPFFIDNCRSRGAMSSLIKVEGIDNEVDAKSICGQQFYCLATDLPDTFDDESDRFYISDLCGFELYDQNGKRLGVITDFDDSTSNVILIVDAIKDNMPYNIYVPINDDLIKSIDVEHSKITMVVAEGIDNLN